MGSPDFWNDAESATKIGRERNAIQQEVETWKKLSADLDDCVIAQELIDEENDPDLERETEDKLKAIERELGAVEFRKMLSAPHDPGNAIFSINAGAGGTEAQDWVEMLLRMYLRWAEQHDFEADVVDMLPGDEAGIKNVTVTVSGPYAYGYLKAESGVHRLVRISPFDSQARRHTSFASMSVYPEAADEEGIEIDEKDLKVDVFRASGAGGQHVNKTESAVRITHAPSGIVVGCQSERSQHKNRSNAMRILKARLLDLQRKEKEDEKKASEAEKKEIAWGSQIRSYVLQPYQKIKDHRTDMEDGNVQKVLDGDLDGFIETYLLSIAERKNA